MKNIYKDGKIKNIALKDARKGDSVETKNQVIKSNHKASDITEFVLRELNYNEKVDEDFNLGEWYGFKKCDNDILRAKYISQHDKNDNYNVNRGKLEFNKKAIAIIHHNEKLEVFEVEFGSEDQLSLKKNDRNELEFDEKQITKLRDFTIDLSIMENIEDLNKTILSIKKRVSKLSIKQRISNVETKVDEKAIRELLSKSNGKCEYCGVSQDQINILDEKKKRENKYGLTKRNRGYKLEVDQIKPDNGYIEGNIVLCCYWCNNAKTDTFTVKEFRDIARGINAVWNQRLKKIDAMKEVIFPPDDSPIWNIKEENTNE